MNTEALFLFLILLLGLVLCSFLGGNCGIKEGLINNNNVIYIGPNGDTATTSTNSNGTQIITLNDSSQSTGSPTIIFTQSSSDPSLFTNSFGITATLSNGNIVFTAPNNGPTITFTSSSPPPSSPSSSSSVVSSSPSSFISSLIPSFDNYNHYTKSSAPTHLQNGMTFTDETGDDIIVITNSDGTQSLKLILVGLSNPIILRSTPTTNAIKPQPNTFYSPDGGGITATIVTDNNGQTAIKVKIGVYTIIFKQSGSTTNSNQITSTQYYGSTGSPIQTSSSTLSYQGPYGNKAYYAQGPNGNAVAGTINTSSSGYGDKYSSSLPPGIPVSQIPPGNEDLYILKSQVVPPVCPVCSVTQSSYHKDKKYSNSNNEYSNDKASCPPCPAPQRCPEPAFECKKVPNYNAIDEQYLPQPVLSDFSTFGM